MAEKKVIELEVTTNLKSLKSQLKEAQYQVAELSDKFGATSEQAIKAAKHAAELKDKIGDAKALTDAFNPDAKFNALTASLGGVVNGFTAYEGALGLVGVESAALQEQLLKVQSAMALSQGLQGLGEARDSFKQLGAVAKNALAGIRSAIGATGIGLIVVALGLIVSNWEALNKAITDAFPGFKKVGDFFKNFSQIASGTLKAVVAGFTQVGKVLGDIFRGDFSGAINDAKKVGSVIATAFNDGYDEKDKEIKKQRYLEKRNFELDLEKAKGKDITAERLKLMWTELSLLDKGSKEYNDKLIAIEEARTQIREKAESDRQKRLEEQKKRAEEKARKDKELRDNDAQAKQEALQQAYDLQLPAKKLEVNAKIEKIVQDNYDAIDKQRQIDLEKAKKAEQDKALTVNNGLSIISNLTSLFAGKSRQQQERAFKIQKAVAISQGLIDTYRSAVSSYTSQIIPGDPSSPIRGFIAAAAAVAAGLANVNNIRKQEFNASIGGGGGGIPTSIGGGGGTSQAPSFNVISGTSQNQLAQLQQKPVQAFVVSGEVTTQQALDRNRLRNATL